MSSLVVIGAQWGDEGKGKLVDYLSSKARYVVRFQGGNNAGHTLVVGGVTTKLRLIPSGILRPDTKCLIGAGVVVDGVRLIDELDELKAAGIDVTPDRLLIDENIELVLEYHRAVDLAREEYKGADKIGTTGRGIGPCYEDRAARSGVRLCELRDLNRLRPKIEENVKQKNLYLKHVLGSAVHVPFANVWRDLEATAQALLPYAGGVSAVLNEAFAREERVVFEGAQAALLDLTFGSVPYVTSSNTIAGGVLTGCGIGPKHIGYVLGVAKAYCTRVGEGPFPTELHDELADTIRTRGGEFGTNTGRPRRCGWMDAVALRYAVKLSGVDSLAITKLDVLAGIEKIRICHRYRLHGEKVHHVPAYLHDFAAVTPEYVELEGWDSDIKNATKWHHLPASARLYLNAIAELCECPVSIVGVGAERESTIFSSSADFLRNFM